MSFLQFMAEHYPAYIWIWINGNGDCIYNINGWHVVNRIDYIITEVPRQADNEYEVLDYEPRY